MDGFFVVVACVSLLCAVTAVLRVRAIGWAVWFWFFVGWHCFYQGDNIFYFLNHLSVSAVHIF